MEWDMTDQVSLPKGGVKRGKKRKPSDALFPDVDRYVVHLYLFRTRADSKQTYSRMEYLKRHQRKRMFHLLLRSMYLTGQTRMIDLFSVKTAPNHSLEGKPPLSS
jgi:hypothetical protein